MSNTCKCRKGTCEPTNITSGQEFRARVENLFGPVTLQLVKKRLEVYRRAGFTKEYLEKISQDGDSFAAFLLGLAYHTRLVPNK